MECPNCHGTNVQTIKMAIANGTSTGSVVGAGVGFDGGVGFGIGSTTTKSALAKELTAPTLPSLPKWAAIGLYLILFLPMGIISFEDGHYILGTLMVVGGFFACGVFYLEHASKESTSSLPQLRISGWVCHQCGHKWIP